MIIDKSIFDSDEVVTIIALALHEDIGSGDITSSSVIPKGKKGYAIIKSKDDGIIAGLPIIEKIFELAEFECDIKLLKNEGDSICYGDITCELSGNLADLLILERTILNFIQRISGIASKTNLFVKKLEGKKAKLLDTRKTIPGHRLLDKYGVKIGGGYNHRLGLYDMIMIKDNHIASAGSLTNAILAAKISGGTSVKIEVEVSNLDEVEEAIISQPDIIMLDNMSLEEMQKAVQLINGKCKIEASGNVNLESISAIADTGVDYISVGTITHSVSALDLSMKIS